MLMCETVLNTAAIQFVLFFLTLLALGELVPRFGSIGNKCFTGSIRMVYF